MMLQAPRSTFPPHKHLSLHASRHVSCLFILQLDPLCFVSLLGVVALDCSKDFSPRSLSSTAPTYVPPPPPPPKNAARMLALALAESAQQVSMQSHSWSSEPLIPVSPLQPQEAFDFQDLPELPMAPIFQTSSDERAERGSSPSPNSTAQDVTTTPCYPSASSPPIKEQPPELTSMITKSPEAAKSSSTPRGAQPETDSTPPDTPLYKCTPLSCSGNLISPTRRSPERKQSLVGQILVHTSSTSTTPAPTTSGSCKDTRVFPQPVPEVSVLSVSNAVC